MNKVFSERHNLPPYLRVIFLSLFFGCMMCFCAFAARNPKLSVTQAVIIKGNKTKLTVKNASSIKWHTSDRRIISIKKNKDKSCTVTGKAAGSACVTVAADGKRMTCSFVVLPKGRRKPLYTGNAEVDYIVSKMIKDAKIKATMSDEELTKALYQWMVKNFVYENEIILKYCKNEAIQFYSVKNNKGKVASQKKTNDGMKKNGYIRYSDKHIKHHGRNNDKLYDTNGVSVIDKYERRTGTCSYFASVYTMICDRMGLKAGEVEGTIKNGEGDFVEHTISWVYISGKKYYVDIGSGIHSYVRHNQLDMHYYKLSGSLRNERYRLEISW